ncbi:MAG TPA: cobalamin-dependent protein, partial [Candidatus Omnitrophota bacterium]|nr:cobalamin-dependent protein [Candidatus Omnitrophota bacterium]
MKREIKKILLIQPPAFVLDDKSDMNPNVPLGIAYIAGVLEERRYEVKILDAFVEGLENEIPVDEGRVLIGLTSDQIEKAIKECKPDVVGVSSLFTMQRRNAHNVCAIAKKAAPGTVVVMGGAHPSAEPEMVLKDPNVDFVVIGEGEMVMAELMKRLGEGSGLSDLDGIAFRDGGKIKVNRKQEYVKDLDALPLPARHLLPMNKYFKFKKSHGINRRSPYASIVTSRGCPFGCTFCSTHIVWGRLYRARSAENVLKEIRHLVKEYGIRELLFEDDNLTLNRERAFEIFRGMVNEKFDLIWRTPNGVAVKTIDEEMLVIMKESGCYQLG